MGEGGGEMGGGGVPSESKVKLGSFAEVKV